MYSSVESSAFAPNVFQFTTPRRHPDAALPAADTARSPRIKPQELVRLILGHRALARRVSVPKTSIALQVLTPSGRPAVLMSFS